MELHAYLGAERGRGSGLAKAIGVTPVLISQWGCRRRQVPAERCRAIETATGGQVTVHDLRPDVFGPPPPDANDPAPATPAIPAAIRNRLDTPEAVARALGVSRESSTPAAVPAPAQEAPAEPQPEFPGDSVVVPFEAPP